MPYIGTGNPSKKAYYYQCYSQTRGRELEHCGNKPVRADEVEERVWDDILYYIKHPDQAIKELKSKLEHTHDSILSVEDEARRVEKLIARKLEGRARVLSLARLGVDDGGISEDEAQQELSALAAEIRLLEDSLTTLREQGFAGRENDRQLKEAESILKSYNQPEKLDAFTTEEKMELMRRFVRRITVTPVVIEKKKVGKVDAEYIFTNTQGRARKTRDEKDVSGSPDKGCWSALGNIS
ncbi:MAG: zinc ribbon domain-containing protein [Acidobacteria bacterium]|nr:zinc ribbon domain-containing protein [Acidobacteriota bacterium]